MYCGIKIGYPNQKNLNVVGFYRQWSKIFNNKPFESYTMKQQELNFDKL